MSSFTLSTPFTTPDRRKRGEERIISRQMIYLDCGPEGTRGHVRYAPYLDFRPLAPDEPRPEDILSLPECAWINREVEGQAAGVCGLRTWCRST